MLLLLNELNLHTISYTTTPYSSHSLSLTHTQKHPFFSYANNNTTTFISPLTVINSILLKHFDVTTPVNQMAMIERDYKETRRNINAKLILSTLYRTSRKMDELQN
jgi:hypothetical protein